MDPLSLQTEILAYIPFGHVALAMVSGRDAPNRLHRP